MRIGIGYDVHRLVNGRKLIIGGVMIDHDKGLAGHSDADVLTHAVIDALLGAAGLGDIGRIFPDNEPRYKDISSLILLEHVNGLLIKENLKVICVDSIIIAQQPRMSEYIYLMEANLHRCLGFDSGQRIVNVKATTEEGLGFTGIGEGIAAKAVCLLEKGDI